MWRTLLWFPKLSLATTAFIDSGAEVNFIDEDFLFKSGIPTAESDRPKQIKALDGKTLAEVTHSTVPVSFNLSGNHIEFITLLLIPSPSSPLVLGYPRLTSHNPHID